MKTLLAQNNPISNDAPMFPTAVCLEEASLPPLGRTPLTDLMRHPEELEAAFQNARRENDAFEASRKFGRECKGAGADAPSKKHGQRKDSSHARADLKPVEFLLSAPFAGLVKLAADFTDWEQSALSMIKSEDGMWSIVVPLRPGHYSYHFIVDGTRRENPHLVLPGTESGGTNTVVKVT